MYARYSTTRKSLNMRGENGQRYDKNEERAGEGKKSEEGKKKNERRGRKRTRGRGRVTCMTSRVLMVSIGIITVTLAAAAIAPNTKDTYG